MCFQGKPGIPGSTGERGPHGEPVSMLSSTCCFRKLQTNHKLCMKTIMTVGVNYCSHEKEAFWVVIHFNSYDVAQMVVSLS